MQNIKELRDDLLKVFSQLRDEEIDPKRAHELSNAAGKIISSVGVQLKYANQRGEKPEIPFLAME